MDLTKQERLIALMGEKEWRPEWASILSQIITGISAEVEEALHRHVLVASRTVVCDVDRHARSVSLKGYPITSVTTIKSDTSRAFGSGTEIDTDLFSIDSQAGVINFDFELQWGPGALEVVYTGGMAADTNAFIAAFQDIAYAVDIQVFYEWQRRENPGLTNQNPSDFGGGSSYFVNPDWAERHGEFLPKLVSAIKRHVNRSRSW